MSGKAVQRALGGHLLVSQSLTKQITAKAIEDEPDFEIMTELERLYTQAKADSVGLDALLNTDCIKRISQALASEKFESSKYSETSKLVVNYLQMLGVARELAQVRGKRTSMLYLTFSPICSAAVYYTNYLKSAYLYLQEMFQLESDSPAMFQKFVNGFHMIRHTDQYWAGPDSDLCCDRVDVNAVSQEYRGLTRGSGITDHQRVVWTMSVPVSSAYTYAMQEFCKTFYTTSDQHKKHLNHDWPGIKRNWPSLLQSLTSNPLCQCHPGLSWIRWLPQFEGQCASTSNASQGYKQRMQIRRKKDDFLSNGINKHALIQLISGRLREKGCHTIQAEGDSDFDIVKAAVSISAHISRTVIGEDTDLLVLLLYHAATNFCKDLYFQSNKGKPNVYNLMVLKCLLGVDVYSDMSFSNAFSGCGTTSRIFGMETKYVFQKVIAGDSVLHECPKVFCTPTAYPATVESTCCETMVSLFNGGKSDSLASLRYSFLAKKVATAKTFVTPGRLPTTTSARHTWKTTYNNIGTSHLEDYLQQHRHVTPGRLPTTTSARHTWKTTYNNIGTSHLEDYLQQHRQVTPGRLPTTTSARHTWKTTYNNIGTSHLEDYLQQHRHVTPGRLPTTTSARHTWKTTYNNIGRSHLEDYLQQHRHVTPGRLPTTTSARHTWKTTYNNIGRSHLEDYLQQHRQHIFILDGPIYRSWNDWARMMECKLRNWLSARGQTCPTHDEGRPCTNQPAVLKMVHCNCSEMWLQETRTLLHNSLR